MISTLLNEIYQINQGQSEALDKELAILIANIEKNGINQISQDAYSSISELRKKVTQDITQHQQQLIEHNEKIKSVTSEAITLQPLQVDDKNVTMASLYRQLFIVLDNYRMVVKSFESTAHQQRAIFEQHKGEFLELYQDINVNIAHQPLLQKLQAELKKTIDVDTMLGNCKNLIALLMKNINGEKETSQFFLKALNDALLNVKNIVDDTSHLNDKNYKNRENWTQGLNNNVNNIKQAVEDEGKKIDLKQRISSEIEDIIKAMVYKQQFDQKEHIKLTSQFKNMKKKLQLVEGQAQQYKSQLDEQKQLNLQDVLTKLPNRAALNQRFETEFNNAKNFDKPLWVVVADIDHFKRINDTYGHNAGDKTLQVISSAISRSLRGSEFIARYGGEEFVFLIPMATKPMVSSILERVREHIKAIPFKFKKERVSITISLGATKVRLEDQTTEAVFERADQALYQAKNEGRDRVVIN